MVGRAAGSDFKLGLKLSPESADSLGSDEGSIDGKYVFNGLARFNGPVGVFDGIPVGGLASRWDGANDGGNNVLGCFVGN